jgi:cytochrome c biogenesis DsbD-like protein
MMKKIIAIVVALFTISGLHAQVQDPVKWNYSATKKSDKEYTVTINATLPGAWHIYSISTPADGPVPTSISFKKNPLVTLDGTVKENGKLETDHDAVFGVDVKYYADKVEFVQNVKLKSAVKTNVTGTIKYMVCNDKMCLPPKTIPFNIQLQ